MKYLVVFLGLISYQISVQAYESTGASNVVEALESQCNLLLKKGDSTSALASCRLDAEDGDVHAMHKTSVIYYEQDDYDNAFYWAQQAALNGDAAMMDFVGVCYQQGLGVEKDSAKEYLWFLRSAESGDLNGQYHLGLYLENRQRYEEAISWYQKLFEARHSAGMAKLARLYTNGWGVERDVGMGYVLARISKQLGDQDAQAVIDYIETRLKTAEDRVKLEAFAEEWLVKLSRLPS